MGTNGLFNLLLVFTFIIGATAFLVGFKFIMLWVKACLGGVSISLMQIIKYRLRSIIPSRIINTAIMCKAANIDVEPWILEEHYVAGGSIERVAIALIEAKKANLELDWVKAAPIDLAGKDTLAVVLKAVDEGKGAITEEMLRSGPPCPS